MIIPSRRQLASYGADQLLENKPVGKVAKELAAALIAGRRAEQAELLASDIAWELEHRGQAANAQVTSAAKLSDSLRRQIASQIKQLAKVQQVIIDERVDESVIGGLRVDTAAHSWDKTIKRELTDIQEAF